MMARGKRKESALTPEEKLAQALVLEDEQPYKVPDNWCWTTLEKVATVVTGGTPSKSHPEYYEGTFPFYKPADLDAGRYVYEASEYLSDEGKAVSRIIPQDSTAVCCIGSIGKCGYIAREGTTNQQINSAIPYFNPLYLYYFLNTDQFANELWSKASATTISIVNKSKMEQCYFPLAPLAEQQRIVDRIEYLFAKLDEAKEKAQSVLDSFETRKAAILHKAFTGELTAKWRAEHGLDMGSWKPAKFSDVLDVRDGTHDSPQYYDTGYPLVTSKNLKDGLITDKDIKYICQEDYDKINERSKVDIGDILFAMIGTIGNPVVVQAEPHFAIKNMALFKSVGKINPFFVKYYLESKTVMDKMQKEAKGSTQKFVALGYLRAFPIDVPMEQEQEEVVRILDSLFAKEQQAKEAAEAVLEKIDLLKKSILARAFRGELGTNDPSEESALELLKRIL